MQTVLQTPVRGRSASQCHYCIDALYAGSNHNSVQTCGEGDVDLELFLRGEDDARLGSCPVRSFF